MQNYIPQRKELLKNYDSPLRLILEIVQNSLQCCPCNFAVRRETNHIQFDCSSKQEKLFQTLGEACIQAFKKFPIPVHTHTLLHPAFMQCVQSTESSQTLRRHCHLQKFYQPYMISQVNMRKTNLFFVLVHLVCTVQSTSHTHTKNLLRKKWQIFFRKGNIRYVPENMLLRLVSAMSIIWQKCDMGGCYPFNEIFNYFWIVKNIPSYTPHTLHMLPGSVPSKNKIQTSTSTRNEAISLSSTGKKTYEIKAL